MWLKLLSAWLMGVMLTLVNAGNTTGGIKFVSRTLRLRKSPLVVGNNVSVSSAAVVLQIRAIDASKRLDGHNRRRRKPQPESVSRNSGLLFSTQQGARLLSFGGPETFAGAIPSSTWAGVVNADNDILTYSNQTDLNYLVGQSSFSEASNQFQFTRSTKPPPSEASICQPLLDPNSAPPNTNCGQKMFSDGLNQVVDSDHDRALSLLSPVPAVTRGVGLSHVVHPDSVHHVQSSSAPNLLSTSLGQYRFALGIQSKPMVSVTEPQVGNNANLHFQDMFQNGPDGSSPSGSQQTLTFMWE